MQLHERPIPGAMFVEEQRPEAPDEERRLRTRNVGVAPKLAQSEDHTQRQEPERSQRQRREEPGFGEEQARAKATPAATSTMATTKP